MRPTPKTLRALLHDLDKRIWSDEELEDMLGHGLIWWNLTNPETNLSLFDLRVSGQDNPQGAAVLWASVTLALTHLLWKGDYKTDVALTPDEHDRYEQLRTDAEERFSASKTTKRLLVKPEGGWN